MNNFICPKCEQNFVNNSTLKRHINTARYCSKREERSPFVCEYCDRDFTQKNAIDRHLPTCIEYVKYECNVKIKSIETKYDDDVAKVTKENSELKIKLEECNKTINELNGKFANNQSINIFVEKLF